MKKIPICKDCAVDCQETCAAIYKLNEIYKEFRTEEKTQLIRQLRKELNIKDYEVSDDLRDLGEKIINKFPELHFINSYKISIGYVKSYAAKTQKGKIINAECTKVSGTWTAYLPYDFVITFYEPNIYHMTENQRKVLMLHELKHIAVGEKGLTIDPHDIEDFKSIVISFGLDWNGFNQEIPDILGE